MSFCFPRQLAAVLACALPFCFATAQSTPTEKKEDTLKLSPFVVSSDKDNGYQASDTLAGTRLRTPLKDIAASISVVTPQLMEDTASNNLLDILVYTAGTEVAGIGGTFSGSNNNSNPSFEEARNSPVPVTRLRGLAAADTTRNFFPTVVPLDSYNTQGLTINRGANAMLFGLGSPAGIIETSTANAEFRNRVRVVGSAASYGSFRESIDLERVLIDQKLSLRVAAVNDNMKFEQDFAYRDVKRIYAAAGWRPLKNTTFRVNAETGKQNQQLPRPNPPVDGLTSWYTYFKQTRPEAIYTAANTVAKSNFERLNNLDAAMAFTTGLNNPSAFYSNPANTAPGGMLIAIPSWANTPATDPAGATLYRMLGVRQTVDARNFAFRNPPTNGQLDPVRNNTFSLNEMVLDRSIFDYRKHSLYGPNDYSNLKLDTFNAAAEQLFLDGNAGIEAVLDRQRTTNDTFANFTGTRGDSLGIDINEQLTNGQPNPNFGRPVVSGLGSASKVSRENLNYRATAFVKHDFTKTFPNWFGRLIGRQSATAFYTDSMAKVFSIGGYNAVVAPTYENAQGGANTFGTRQLNAFVYVGPSLLNTTSPNQAQIGNVRDRIGWPAQLTSWTIHPGTNYQWAQRTDAVITGDWEQLATGVSATRQEIVTYGEILQSYWLNGLLVSTLGWRHDQVENFAGSNPLNPVTGSRFVNRPHVASQLARTNTLFSAGYALHMPKRWVERMPGRVDVSLYYNDSENFRLTPPRNTIFNQPIDAEGGKTRDWGIGVRAFDGKLNFRLTRYKTVQENVTDPRLTGSSNLLTFVADAERTIIQGNTPEQIAAVGYVGFDNPNAAQVFKDYMAAWNFRISGTQANGTRTITLQAPVGVADVTGAESEGYEFEVTYNPLRNWRITANVSQQEATRGKAAPNLDALFADRLAQYFRPEVINLLNGSYLSGVYAPTNSFLTLRSQTYYNAQVSENQPVPELVEWRANVITNYEFGREGRLKGWSVGGAGRRENGIVVGYPIKVSAEDPTLLVRDTENAWKSDPTITFDGWISYARPLFKNRVKWKIQLNVRNLLDDNLLVPMGVNPVAVGDTKNYTLAHARIGAERTWTVTSSFEF